MTPHNDLQPAEWRDAFLAERGIALADLRAWNDWDERNELDAADLRVPARYSKALAADPGMRNWLGKLVSRAARDRSRAVPSVTTGPSVLMLGKVGTGKTHEAWGAVRGLAACGVRSHWHVITAADFYARLRPRHGIDSEAEFREIATASLLVLDDLGAEKPSEWTEAVNYRLVNCRYEHELATVLISNLPLDDRPGEGPGLRSVLGDRVMSRLAEMTETVVMEGPDRRRQAS
jgi:DNA replication protein DnaC